MTGKNENFSFTDLRRHWSGSEASERANPPADEPSHQYMMEHGKPMETAPLDETVWLIMDGSVGVFLGSHFGNAGWFVQDGGDLWPSKPTRWFPRTALTPSTIKTGGEECSSS